MATDRDRMPARPSRPGAQVDVTPGYAASPLRLRPRQAFSGIRSPRLTIAGARAARIAPFSKVHGPVTFQPFGDDPSKRATLLERSPARSTGERRCSSYFVPIAQPRSKTTRQLLFDSRAPSSAASRSHSPCPSPAWGAHRSTTKRSTASTTRPVGKPGSSKIRSSHGVEGHRTEASGGRVLGGPPERAPTQALVHAPGHRRGVQSRSRSDHGDELVLSLRISTPNSFLNWPSDSSTSTATAFSPTRPE